RPLVGVGISLAFGLLCYLAASDKQAVAFAWMMAISGLSSIFTWGSICFTHVRFRRALKVQGRDTNELTFTAMSGVYGSIWGVILNILVLIAEFWYSLFPTNKADAYNFFENYLNAVVLVFLFAVFLIWKKFNVIFLVRAKDIDLDTGRKVEDWDLLRQEIAEEKAYIASKPWYYQPEEQSILVAQRKNRPCSPHLDIYQPQLTWVLSGLHRITGVGLAFGFYAVTCSYAFGLVDTASLLGAFSALPVAIKVAFKALASFPFAFHAWNGVRHLVWDSGHEANKKGVYTTGYIVLGLSALSFLGLMII
ncbi:glyceraldehyde-3-phosphate dehydrogenase 1, partial [Pichia californica]